MKVGFASLVGLPPISLQESVAWAAANGLQGMEVNIGPGYPVTDGKSLHGHLDLDRILSDGPEPIRALFDDNGIELTALAPMINLLTSDDALRAQRIAYMRKTIDAAAAARVSHHRHLHRLGSRHALLRTPRRRRRASFQ